MSSWVIFVVSFLAGALVMALGGAVAARWFARKPAAVEKTTNSVMLDFLKERNIKDNKKNLHKMQAAISLGEQAGSLKEELSTLQMLNVKLQDDKERLEEEVNGIQRDLKKATETVATQNTGIAPRLTDAESVLDRIRADARAALNSSLVDAADAPNASSIINLTDLYDAIEKEESFTSGSSASELKQAFEDSWIHAILRAHALFETYCVADDTGMTEALSDMAWGLKLVARRQGFRITPIRLLVPEHIEFQEVETVLSALTSIAPIRNKLRALAQATVGAPEGLPTMLVDCLVSEVTGVDGFGISAQGTAFRTEDWQVGA